MNAAEATVIGCALMAMQVGAVMIIVSTVSGKTAIQLSSVIPQIYIIALTRNISVARKLQLYKGVIPMVYNSKQSLFYYYKIEVFDRNLS